MTDKIHFVVRVCVGLGTVVLAVMLVTSAVAQPAPLRVVQSSDGTLHVVQGATSWTLLPDPIGDSDLAGLNPVGEIDGIVGPQPGPPQVVQASDGGLYIVSGQNSWTLVPDQISDSDLAALDQSGELDGVIPAELVSVSAQAPATVVPTPTPTAPAAAANAAPGICGVVPSGLVGCWLASGNAQDVIGGNDGTLIGGANFAPGIVGQAFGFNGKGQYVKVPRSPKLGGAVSIAFWMKADKANPLNACCQGLVTTAFYGVEWEAGGIAFFVSSDGGSWHISGGYPVPASEWHHVAGVFDGTALSLYVDGVLRGNVPWSGAIFPMPNNGFLAFGSEDGRPICSCVGNRYFNGLIGDVLLYNRALTAAEVTQIFNTRS